MNKLIIPNIIRIFFIFFLQILIFKQIRFPIGDIGTAQFIIYPLTILLLPINTPRVILLILAFIIGISIDVFYDSLGVHSATLILTAYLRNIIIALFKPYEGYNINDVPTVSNMGFSWFFIYSSILFFIHVFTYFSIEAFSFVFFFEIFINTIFSFFISFLLIIIYQFIFRPKV